MPAEASSLATSSPPTPPIEEEEPVVEMQIEPEVEEGKGKKEATAQLYVDPGAVTLIGDGQERVPIWAAVFATDPTTGTPRPDRVANRTIQMTVDRPDWLTLEMEQASTPLGCQATLRTNCRVVGDEPVTATVQVTAQTEAEILDETIQVTLKPLRPELKLESESRTLVADGQTTVQIKAQVLLYSPDGLLLDVDTEATPRIQFEVEPSEVYTLKPSGPLTPEQVQMSLRTRELRTRPLPPANLVVRVTAGGAQRTERLTISPQPVALELEVIPSSLELVADGRDSVELQARLILADREEVQNLDLQAATANIDLTLAPSPTGPELPPDILTLRDEGIRGGWHCATLLSNRIWVAASLEAAILVDAVSEGHTLDKQTVSVRVKPVEARLLVVPKSLELPADGQSTFTLAVHLEIRHDGGLWREAGSQAQISIVVADPDLLTVISQALEASTLEAEIGSIAEVQHPTATTVQVRATVDEKELATEMVRVTLKPVEATDVPLVAARLRPEEKVEEEPVSALPEEAIEEALPGERPSTWVCANCGVENQERMLFCTKCGMPKSTAVVTWRCASCGAKNRQGLLFCTKCGTTRPQEIAADWICPHCQRLNAARMSFCTGCGGKREEET